MAIEMRQNLAIGDRASDRLAVLIHQNRGNPEHVMPVPRVSTFWMEWQTLQVTPSASYHLRPALG